MPTTWSKVLRPVKSLLFARSRRVSVGLTRAYVELRLMTGRETADLAQHLAELVQQRSAVDWVEVNAATGRAVFAYQKAAVDPDELASLLDEAEQRSHLSQQPLLDTPHEHPTDWEPLAKLLAELLIDAWSTMVGLGLRVSPIPRLPFGAHLIAVLTVVRSSPELRRRLEQRLGTDRCEVLLNALGALTLAAVQRPVSSFIDVLHKVALLAEREAVRRAWRMNEATLCSTASSSRRNGAPPPPRPCPFPEGPIEEYSRRAWAVSLSGFAFSFLATHSFQRATAALFGGFPRPALIGRDIFAARLSRDLARRGIVMLDQKALRKLDRIDCLVVSDSLAARRKFIITEVRAQPGEQAQSLHERALSLFDQNRPLAQHRAGSWQLLPFQLSKAADPGTLVTHALERSKQGALMLALEHAETLVALVEVEVLKQTGIEEIVAAARAAELRVVVATDDDATLAGLGVDDFIPKAEGLRRGIMRLQREGAGVALVATGSCDALELADVAIGLALPGEPPPWGAHLICREDLADVRYLIEAMVTAKRVARQCVNIALGAATMGTLVSAGGKLRVTGRRVVVVVNLATLIAMINSLRHAAGLHRKLLRAPYDPTPWHALDAGGAMKRLRSRETGLSPFEIAVRRPRSHRVRGPIAELGAAISDELFNPLAPLLAAGASLSAVVGSFSDATLVAMVVGLNAAVGGVQRFLAERRIRQLTREARRHARVRRNGAEFVVDAQELVAGDLVALGANDVVPADCRVLEAFNLEVDMSSLTGESLPVRKTAAESFESHVADRSSMLYEGTTLVSGRALGLVVSIGDDTEARRAAIVPQRSRQQGGIEQRLRSLMAATGPVALAAGASVIGAGLLRGRKLEDLVGAGVSLAVASVPEGLPVLATAAQLRAAERLSSRGALVRHARCIEALGRVNVVCFDKTGTVTDGRVELCLVSDGRIGERLGELGPERLNVLSAALRACPVIGAALGSDPLDEAVRRACKSEALSESYRLAGFQRLTELSYEAGRSYHATLARVTSAASNGKLTGNGSAGLRLTVKGAPEVLLPKCASFRARGTLELLDSETRAQLALQVDGLAQRGLRILCVAERRLTADAPATSVGAEQIDELELLGFVAFRDPVRATAARAVRGLREAGIRVVMLTGDHASTAEAIATELELLGDGRVMSGSQLSELSDDELDALSGEVSVFARVTPTQKVQIVKSLQRAGRVVAMAGDGANDAPALRVADVGIAVGEQSTAAARVAADIVLADGRLETLVEAMAEGRAMWESVRDAVSILVGGNFGEIAFTLLGGLIDGRPPLNARQLLLINLLTDVAPALAIALRPPRIRGLADTSPEQALGQTLTRDMILRALVTASGAGGAWLVARILFGHRSARTVGLAALVTTQLGQTLRAGGNSRPVVWTSAASAALMASIIQTPFVSHFFGCRPMGPIGWSLALGSSILATRASDSLGRFLDRAGVERLGEATALLERLSVTRNVRDRRSSTLPVRRALGQSSRAGRGSSSATED